MEVLRAGGTPQLAELRLHNGTIYRWNRPVYDVMNGRPHLRVENRVLPAGPTVVDMLANAAFYFGLVRAMAEADRPLWTQMTFSAAEENFHTAARDGIGARIWWPRLGEVAVTDLVLRASCCRWPTTASTASASTRCTATELLGIIEARCRTRRNGAVWQAEMVRHLQDDRDIDRHGRAARDAPPVQRPPARQRPGAHLAAAESWGSGAGAAAGLGSLAVAVAAGVGPQRGLRLGPAGRWADRDAGRVVRARPCRSRRPWRPSVVRPEPR